MTEKSILQEKLMKAREEKEQLNQRIKLLEGQVKRSKVPQDLNTREHTEKVISTFHIYIYIYTHLMIFFFTVATFLWKIFASR